MIQLIQVFAGGALILMGSPVQEPLEQAVTVEDGDACENPKQPFGAIRKNHRAHAEGACLPMLTPPASAGANGSVAEWANAAAC